MQTKLVLLGTGTPNACPNANGPSSAVVVGDRAYLVDFGPGVVRQASAAYFNGVDALWPENFQWNRALQHPRSKNQIRVSCGMVCVKVRTEGNGQKIRTQGIHAVKIGG